MSERAFAVHPLSGDRRGGAGARIAAFSIVFVGVGAVGAAAAESAARAGVGRITLVDRDVVEESNLARQFLFDAEDAARVAAQGRRPPRRACARSSPDVEVSRHRRGPRSPERPRDPGRPRPRLRRLGQLRDAPARLRRGAGPRPALDLRGLRGRGRPRRRLRARATPCLRCYLEALPPAGSGPTCDTAGVVPTLPPLVAAARHDGGAAPGCRRGARRGGFCRWRSGTGASARGGSSRALAPRRRARSARAAASRRWKGRAPREIVKLCGRSSVQVAPAGRERPDFDALEARLARVGARPPVAAASQRRPRGRQPDGLSPTAVASCAARTTRARARALYDRYVGR